MENENLYPERDRRARNRAASAAVQPENTKKSGRKNDAFVKLIAAQCFITAAAIAFVFLLGKVSSPVLDELKKAYSEAMSSDMSAPELYSAFKEKAHDVFSPVTDEKPEGEEEKADEPESENTTAMEKLGSEAGETVAVGEMEQAGGRDIETEEAAKGTSFAMYEISEKPAMPVPSERITSGFGYRVNPVSGNYGFHTGIDLSSPLGTPVSAVFFGIVEETGEDDQWGKYVLIKHSDNLETYYCHCSEVFVSGGDVIRKGETVALVGSTGWSTGPHLHFEVRIGGVRVDPSILLFGKKST